MDVRYDFHTHTTYSDGSDWSEMVRAAAELGLAGIGFADHCPVVPDFFGRRDMYDFVETYPERRAEFRAAADQGIRVLDGAEVNYDPACEDEIAAFLETASFEYTIGSVHFADGFDLVRPGLGEASVARRREAVAAYVEWQVALIESELFDIVSHLDLAQRSPQLRGVMDRSDYERLADALVDSTTVPELNAGRLDRPYGALHPHADWLDAFAERDVAFVVGSDAHTPGQLTERLALLRDRIEDVPVRVVNLPPVLG